MEVRCNLQECKYNGGLFCQKPILLMYGGVCGELVDKDGRQKNPTLWQKQFVQDQSPTDDNVH